MYRTFYCPDLSIGQVENIDFLMGFFAGFVRLLVSVLLQVSEDDFNTTMTHINEIFDEAEALNCRTYMEGCLACVTGYLIHCCCKTHYEKVRLWTNKMLNDGGLLHTVFCVFFAPVCGESGSIHR